VLLNCVLDTKGKQLKGRNTKNLVMGSKEVPDTKMNWLTISHKLNLTTTHNCLKITLRKIKNDGSKMGA
jgi:hypothetical protein